MIPLTECVADHAKLTRGQFLARHANAVLLHLVAAEKDEDPTFKTSVAPELQPTRLSRFADVQLTRPIAALGLGRSVVAEKAARLVILPIAKRPNAVFSDRVGVGRTRNTDVYLASAKVSKYHAYFTTRPGAAGPRYFLTDAGSTNGSFVLGKRLATDTPVEVHDQAEIAFGKLLFVFYTPEGLYRLLGATGGDLPP